MKKCLNLMAPWVDWNLIFLIHQESNVLLTTCEMQLLADHQLIFLFSCFLLSSYHIFLALSKRINFCILQRTVLKVWSYFQHIAFLMSDVRSRSDFRVLYFYCWNLKLGLLLEVLSGLQCSLMIWKLMI